MANINGQALFEQKASQWGAHGSSGLFPSDYIKAANNAVAEYAIQMDLNTKPARITSQEDDIGVSDTYEFVIGLGIDYWLVRFGNFKSGTLDLNTAYASFQGALTKAMVDRDRTAAKAATDEEMMGAFDT